MPTIRRIYKQGNSLVVTLPRSVLDALGIAQDDYVDLHLIIGKTMKSACPDNGIFLSKRPPRSPR